MVSLMYMKFDAPNTSFVAGTEQVFIAMDAACFCDRELREESIDSSGEKRRTRSRFHGAGQPPLSNSRNFLMASALFFSDATSNRTRA